MAASSWISPPAPHRGVSAIIPGGRSPHQVAANMSVNTVPPMSAERAASLVAAALAIREYY
jgi:aryl-alcohol dehydrogenase-like predicted oxidoreductase